MHTYPLSIQEMGLCAAIASSIFVWGFFFKLIIPAKWFAGKNELDHETKVSKSSDESRDFDDKNCQLNEKLLQN